MHSGILTTIIRLEFSTKSMISTKSAIFHKVGSSPHAGQAGSNMRSPIRDVKHDFCLSRGKQKDSPVASGALLPSKKPLGFKGHCIFHKVNIPRFTQFPQSPQTADFVECSSQSNIYFVPNKNNKCFRSPKPG